MVAADTMAGSVAPPSQRAFSWFDVRQARIRTLLSLSIGVTLALALSQRLGWAVRVVAGWDAAAVLLIALAGSLILTADEKETRRRAAAEDPGRTTVWVLVLFSSAVSLFAASVLLRRAKTLAPESEGLLALLCFIAVVGSWALTHITYTLRYAHLYYREDEDGTGGLQFPGGRDPDDLDFAYYSFTIGMCFQVSDVTVSGRALRRATLVHALLSFAYNTVILALALNLTFGLIG